MKRRPFTLPVDLWLTGAWTMKLLRMFDPTVDLADAAQCPEIPDCTFVGSYVDANDDCWCIYFCEGPPPHYKFEPCP